MPPTPPATPKARKSKRPLGRRTLGLLANGALVLLLVLLVLALGGALARIFGLWGDGPGTADHGDQHAEVPAPGGQQVLPTGPSQRVGPVEVSATEIDLGRVPLSTWVTPTFKVRNVSQVPVTLVVPTYSVETLEGC